MNRHQQKQMAEWILAEVSKVNPYNRQQQNDPILYNLYNSGFLAAYLASLMQEDPWIRKRFERHCSAKGPAARG